MQTVQVVEGSKSKVRELNPEMESYLDSKLSGMGAAQVAVEKKDARTLFVLAAQACVGIREEGGNNDGPLVQLIQDTVDGKDKWPWCMSFVQTCLAYAEKKTGVKSPIIAHEHVLSVWNANHKAQKIVRGPLPGAIVIWQHGAGPSGHTGIVIGADQESFQAVEGNTEAGVKNGKVERDGGGVYQTNRVLKGEGHMKVLGFLRPFE